MKNSLIILMLLSGITYANEHIKIEAINEVASDSSKKDYVNREYCLSQLIGTYDVDLGDNEKLKIKINKDENNLLSSIFYKDDNLFENSNLIYIHKSEIENDRFKSTFNFFEFDSVKNMCFIGKSKNGLEHFYYIDMSQSSKDEINKLHNYLKTKFSNKYSLDDIKNMRYFFVLEGDLLTPIYMIFPAQKI